MRPAQGGRYCGLDTAFSVDSYVRVVASPVQKTEGIEPHEMPYPNADPADNRQRLRWGFAVFAAMALFFLWQEHRAHLLGVLPWLFLLACPLMHRFMHHGHGAHGSTQPGNRNEKQPEKHREHEHSRGGATEGNES